MAKYSPMISTSYDENMSTTPLVNEPDVRPDVITMEDVTRFQVIPVR